MKYFLIIALVFTWLQALFARLQQLASVAGNVLLGKEKIQKVLLSRLTETVVMWLSEEQDFWDVFEDDSVELQPSGLQQACLIDTLRPLFPLSFSFVSSSKLITLIRFLVFKNRTLEN